MTQLQKTPHEEAVLLKQYGFDYKCNDYWYISSRGELVHMCNSRDYDNFNRLKGFTSCPTIQLALKWLRDVKGKHAWVISIWQPEWNNYSYQYYYIDKSREEWNGSTHYETYDEAEMEALRKALKDL